MRNRKQNGQIIAINDRWYVRYWERRNNGGTIERKRVSRLLGAVTTRGKKPPADVVNEAEEFMATINSGTIPAERLVSFADFVEQTYLPWAKETKKPSTYKGYRDAWRLHLKPVSSRERGSLKDVRTYTVQGWLNQIGRENLSRNSLRRIQSVLSGIFKQAKRLGFFDGVNPVQDTAVNPKAPEPAETYAYSLEEVQTILAVLPDPAATAFAVASFVGLRLGEISGLDWSDYHDGALLVSRAVWNGLVDAPKTRKSCAAVPVIKPLAERLEMHRLRCGKLLEGPVFANSIGGRLNMANLVNRTILPALNRCAHCGLNEGIAHLKQEHQYERDPRLPEWHGWHAARRGLASNLNRLGVDDSVIQRILRHSNINVTQSYYIKVMPAEVRSAMASLEIDVAEQTAVQSLRDSDRTVNLGSGATPESVN